MPSLELSAALKADRTILHVGQELDVEKAYTKLLSEASQTMAAMNSAEKAVYSKTLPAINPEEVKDLSLAYASANFKSIDKNNNGSLELGELQDRLTQVSAQAPALNLPGLPAAMEARMLGGLVSRFSYLRSMTKTGSWWNFNMIDPAGITGADLKAALAETNSIRKHYVSLPLLPGQPVDKDTSHLPTGVSELFESAGVTMKTLDRPVSTALAAYTDSMPIIGMSAALYNPGTREIFTNGKDSFVKAKSHEIGHAVDDALVPGMKMFSDSPEYNKAVDADIRRLPADIDWNKALPMVHIFILSGLQSGGLDEGARRELFAELYQNGDPHLAGSLRQYFPNTGNLVDSTLSREGISRLER